MLPPDQPQEVALSQTALVVVLLELGNATMLFTFPTLQVNK